MNSLSAQSSIFNTFELNVFGITLQPSYLHAVTFVFLIFLVLISVARLRHLYVKWSTGGWHAWVFMGFVLALLMEGFFILGGRTVMTELLGWKNPPKPIATVLDAGRNQAIKVLGVTDTIPESNASGDVTIDDVLNLYNYLDEQEKANFRSQIISEE